MDARVHVDNASEPRVDEADVASREGVFFGKTDDSLGQSLIPTAESASKEDWKSQPYNHENKDSQSPHSKPCSLCQHPRDVLIRCQIDETKKWYFVCTGKCWRDVSGGKADGDKAHPLFRYGGMWKNKHEMVSAKIKGRAKEENKGIWNGTPGPHRMRGGKGRKGREKKGTVSKGERLETGDRGSDVEVENLDDSDEWELDGDMP